MSDKPKDSRSGDSLLSIEQAFLGMARKYNHFSEGSAESSERKCSNCVRRQFSFPDTCNDGWPLGSSTWVDRGAKCINWTERGMNPTPLKPLEVQAQSIQT